MRQQQTWRMHPLLARCHIPPVPRRPLLSLWLAPHAGQSARGDIAEDGRIPPTGPPQLHIETKISPLETACIATGLYPERPVSSAARRNPACRTCVSCS